jgi:hypothetical protein
MKKALVSILLSLSMLSTISVHAVEEQSESSVDVTTGSTVSGDVNGDGMVNVLDTLALKNHIVEGNTVEEYNYDINQSGSVDINDVYNLNQKVVEKIHSLEDIPAYYKITDEQVRAYTLDPTVVIFEYAKYTGEISINVPDYYTDISVESLGLDDRLVYYFRYDGTGTLGDVKCKRYTVFLNTNKIDIDNIVRLILTVKSIYPDIEVTAHVDYPYVIDTNAFE